MLPDRLPLFGVVSGTAAAYSGNGMPTACDSLTCTRSFQFAQIEARGTMPKPSRPLTGRAERSPQKSCNRI